MVGVYFGRETAPRNVSGRRIFLISGGVGDVKFAHERAGDLKMRPKNAFFELRPGEGIFLICGGVVRPLFYIMCWYRHLLYYPPFI